ncbi:MAG: hypothetical protein Q4C10_14950 [Clostridia bacterium]|nr:hypothetical protein [Clostridia bacterium]
MSLILRILIGLVIGATLGCVVLKATWIGVLGELFVSASAAPRGRARDVHRHRRALRPEEAGQEAAVVRRMRP